MAAGKNVSMNASFLEVLRNGVWKKLPKQNTALLVLLLCAGWLDNNTVWIRHEVPSG